MMVGSSPVCPPPRCASATATSPSREEAPPASTPNPFEGESTVGAASESAAAARSAWDTFGSAAPPLLSTARARADSGAAATRRANPRWVSSPSALSSPASTSASAHSRSRRSTRISAWSRAALASIASSSAACTATVIFDSSAPFAARSRSACSAASLSACTPASSSPARDTPAPAASNAAPALLASSRIAASCAAAGSRFTLGLFRMFLARAAYLSVFSVSSRFVSVGLTHAIMHVLEFPPRES